MSDHISSKIDSDVEDTSSWDVLSDKNSSRSSFIENIVEEEFDETFSGIPLTENELEHVFLDITSGIGEATCEDIEDIENIEDKIKEGTYFPDPEWMKPKSKSSDKFKFTHKFKTVTIAGSILILTGLSLLCFLYPTETSKASLVLMKNDYFNIVKGNPIHLREAFNKTSEILVDVYNTNILNNTANEFFNTDDDGICYDEDNFGEENDIEMNFAGINNNFNNFQFAKASFDFFNQYSLADLQNTILNSISYIKDACSNHNIHIFLCSLLQDICLIKLIQHLERKQNVLAILQETSRSDKKSRLGKVSKKLTSFKSKTNKSDKKSTKTENAKSKLEQKSMPQLKHNSSLRLLGELAKSKNKSHVEIPKNFFSTISATVKTENEKSDCEKKFEELEIKWKSLGMSHRQKIQEIKKEFKTEMFQMKEKEKEISLRKQKIKLIRDKYVQRIKADREHYLSQLKKIREERQRVMYDICNKKEVISQARDASVGNYGIFVSQFDLKDQISSVNKGEETLFKTDKTETFPTLKFKEYSNFWENLSVPKISQESKQRPKTKRKYSQKEKETAFEKTFKNNKNDEISFIQNVVSTLINNLTDSLHNSTLNSDRNIENFDNHSETTLTTTKIGRKLMKKIPKKSKQQNIHSKKTENSTLLAQYPYTFLKPTKTCLFLPTISSVEPNQANKNMTTIDLDGKVIALSTSNILPFSLESNNSHSCSTMGLQNPAAMQQSQRKFNNQINKSDPFRSSLRSSSYSEIAPPKRCKQEVAIKNYLNLGTVSTKKHSQTKGSLAKKNKKTSIPSNNLGLLSFNNGFNEKFSFVPDSSNLTPFTFYQQKIDKTEQKEISSNEFNINGNVPSQTTRTKSITLRDLLKRSKNNKAETYQNSLAILPIKKHEETKPKKSIEDLTNSQYEVFQDDDTENSLQKHKPNKSESNPQKTIENELKLILRETPKKQDLYKLLFDDKAPKVKKEEEILENQHAKVTSPPQFQLMSKQDPKLPKKVYLFKGRL